MGGGLRAFVSNRRVASPTATSGTRRGVSAGLEQIREAGELQAMASICS